LVAESWFMGDSMFRTVKNVTASLALMGLVIAQPALAVRSSESLPSANVAHVDRVGTPMGSVQSDVRGHPAYGWLIGGIIVAAVIAIIISDHHENKSPG
jgi:hypothetical protein